jgi:two-component system, LytTR family, response regulator
MRVLIVDDEPLSQRALSDVLSGRTDIEHFDVAGDAPRALDRIRLHRYDVLLLDIHMPEISGLELVELLQRMGAAIPAVIFITAYQDHALKAFEMKALDYILKPFEPARVHEALDRAANRSAEQRAAALLATLGQLRSGSFRSARIAIKVKSRVVFLDPADLITAEASGNYVVLHERSGSHLLRESISELTGKLHPYGFVRIHRSVLVNSAFVDAVENCVTGDSILRMKNGKEYNVTRTFKDNLKELAHFWIGPDAFGSG